MFRVSICKLIDYQCLTLIVLYIFMYRLTVKMRAYCCTVLTLMKLTTGWKPWKQQSGNNSRILNV